MACRLLDHGPVEPRRAAPRRRSDGRRRRAESGPGLTIVGTVRSRAALLLVDVVNDLDFPGSEPLVRAAERMAPRLARLAERSRQRAFPSST